MFSYLIIHLLYPLCICSLLGFSLSALILGCFSTPPLPPSLHMVPQIQRLQPHPASIFLHGIHLSSPPPVFTLCSSRFCFFSCDTSIFQVRCHFLLSLVFPYFLFTSCTHTTFFFQFPQAVAPLICRTPAAIKHHCLRASASLEHMATN